MSHFRGFFRGLIAGGILGAVATAMLAPATRARTRERLKTGGELISRRAVRLWRRGAGKAADTMMDKEKH